MAREKRPDDPLPVGYVPPGGIPHKVEDGEDWKKLAFRWFLNVEDLISFNFNTRNPDEVNWYLRRNVGCTLTTRDTLNYVFSSKDKPGIVYRPATKIVARDSIEEFNERMGSGTDLGKKLQEANQSDELYDHIGFALNVNDFVQTLLAVSAAELGALGLAMDLAGAFAAQAALFMALGGPHLGAVNDIKKDNAVRGISQGIVMGAAGESGQFIKANFIGPAAGRYGSNRQYPDQNKNFLNSYLGGLVSGVHYGRKLTRTERALFFKHVDHLAGRKPAGDFYKNLKSKTDKQKIEYYEEVAVKFRKEALK